MKRIAMFVLAMVSMFSASAEDGSRLWLRYDKVQRATVTGPECIAAQELRNYYDGERVNLVIDASMAQDAYPENNSYAEVALFDTGRIVVNGFAKAASADFP